MRPIIALLTDFGTQDHYVGAMKGAILASCPNALLVDVVHDLPPHDVRAGAYALAAAYRAFPGGTTFLAVVDPGVGTERRALAVDAGGYRFVAPDNGLLTFVFREQPAARAHEITNRGLFRHEVSRTFHARDVFGPVAGRLATGMPLHEAGAALDDPMLLTVDTFRQVRDGEWEATIINVDRFGNLTTSLTRAHLDEILGPVHGDPTEVQVRLKDAVLPLVETYDEVHEGDGCALVGSSGRLEIALNRASAAELYGVGIGELVLVRRVGT